jgi:hypothetical protein
MKAPNETGPRTLKMRRKLREKSVIRCERKKNWNDNLGTTWRGVKVIQNSYNDNINTEENTHVCREGITKIYTIQEMHTKFLYCVLHPQAKRSEVLQYILKGRECRTLWWRQKFHQSIVVRHAYIQVHICDVNTTKNMNPKFLGTDYRFWGPQNLTAAK